MIHIGFMYKARYQYGYFSQSWIPRLKLLQVVNDEEGIFVDRGSANPSPPRSYTYYEIKYGEPDESNVEGYWIDDEIEVELEKPTGKERERQPDNERPRDYYDRDYGTYWGNQ